MSARQPFRPTPRPDSQLPSSQPDSKGFQRMDTDLGNAPNKTFNLSGLFNQKKRDQPLPARKSKSHDDYQVPPQGISNNSWSAGSHTSKLDISPAPSPILSSTASGLGNVSSYQSSGMPSAQVENMPSSPIVDNGSVTGSFFAQEANPHHLLPIINEVDEDAEMVNGPTTGSASLFFTGRYSDSSNSRKRTQRVDEDVDDIENVNGKRFKSEQVGAHDSVRCRWRGLQQRHPKQASGSAIRSRPASYTHAASLGQLGTSQHELDTLLGLDSDAYISENLKKHEDLKEKWANSSIEEWKAGGQGKTKKSTEALRISGADSPFVL